MDQNQRLERGSVQRRRLSGGDMNSFGIDNLPPDTAEQFLQQVIAFETAPTFTDFAQLNADGGVARLRNSARAGDRRRLTARDRCAVQASGIPGSHQPLERSRTLFGVVARRAERGARSTRRRDRSVACRHSCDDAQATCYLTYYASERERQRWRQDFPG